MATKKRKKLHCAGQRKPGGGYYKRGSCARTRCKGQMDGSTKGGKPKRRTRTVCLKPRRRKAAKRSARPKRKAIRRTKGVMSHGRMVFGAAADAVKRKRARKGHHAPKRRHRAIHGVAGMSIGHAPVRHHHKGEVAIVKLDTGAVIGEGYTVAEAVKHAKRKRVARAKSVRAARRAVYVKAM